MTPFQVLNGQDLENMFEHYHIRRPDDNVYGVSRDSDETWAGMHPKDTRFILVRFALKDRSNRPVEHRDDFNWATTLYVPVASDLLRQSSHYNEMFKKLTVDEVLSWHTEGSTVRKNMLHYIADWGEKMVEHYDKVYGEKKCEDQLMKQYDDWKFGREVFCKRVRHAELYLEDEAESPEELERNRRDEWCYSNPNEKPMPRPRIGSTAAIVAAPQKAAAVAPPSNPAARPALTSATATSTIAVMAPTNIARPTTITATTPKPQCTTAVKPRSTRPTMSTGEEQAELQSEWQQSTCIISKLSSQPVLDEEPDIIDLDARKRKQTIPSHNPTKKAKINLSECPYCRRTETDHPTRPALDIVKVGRREPVQFGSDGEIRAWQRKCEPHANVLIIQSDTTRLEHHRRAHLDTVNPATTPPCSKSGVRVIRAVETTKCSVVFVEDQVGQYQRVHRANNQPWRGDKEHLLIGCVEYRFNEDDKYEKWDGDDELEARAAAKKAEKKCRKPTSRVDDSSDCCSASDEDDD